jgi:hypothetical protein
MQTHVVLPPELVEEVDSLAGRRKRSQFIEDAIRTRFACEARPGSYATRPDARSKEYPHLATPEERSVWVQRLRSFERDPWLDAWYRQL